MLINHYSIFLKCLITYSIKFFSKKSFRVSKRVCRIIYNYVIFSFSASQKPKPVLMIYMHPFVIKASCRIRKIFHTYLYEFFIRLNNIYFFNFGICCKFGAYASVTAAYYKHFFNIGMYRHRYMRNHLVIYKFICF